MDKKKILVIDDEVSITKFLKTALERSGHYVVSCETDGMKALATAKSFVPDLILLDINLPDVPGGVVSASLKEDVSLRNVPIVFLTGMVSQDEALSGLTIAGHAALAKPIQIEKLIECIEKNLPA